MTNSTKTTGVSGESSDAPLYAADEEQPESSNNERHALAEREDGTIRAGKLPQDYPGGAPAHAVGIIKLTEDEHQPIDAAAEYHALSEREDGTNVG